MTTTTPPTAAEAVASTNIGLATALVSLDVQTFKPLPELSVHSMALLAAPSHVKPGTHHQPNDKLHVRRGSVILRFKIESKQANYVPVGLAFQDEATNAAVVSGGPGSPFSSATIDGGTVQVTNTVVNAPGTSEVYKFSVVIQRTSDGALGLIDPFIENEN